MTQDLLSLWGDTVKRVARRIDRDYPEAEAEDVSQHLYMKILEKPEAFRDPDEVGTTSALFRLGREYATKVRAEALHLSVQYNYRTDDIRDILETTFDRDRWLDGFVPEDAESIKPSADAMDLQSDIAWGVSQLPEKDRMIIFRKYALREELEGTDRKRLQRALERLTDTVNSYARPGYPRRAMSNARAQHIIGASYE